MGSKEQKEFCLRYNEYIRNYRFLEVRVRRKWYVIDRRDSQLLNQNVNFVFYLGFSWLEEFSFYYRIWILWDMEVLMYVVIQCFLEKCFSLLDMYSDFNYICLN